MKRLSFLVLIFICCSVLVVGQDDKSSNSWTQNAYASAGLGVPAISLNVGYDIYFLDHKKIKLGPQLIAGFITVGDFDGGGESSLTAGAGISLLLGKESETGKYFYLETDAGILTHSLEDTDFDILWPNNRLFLGFRFGSKKTVFRLGAGVPEMIQFSIGRKF